MVKKNKKEACGHLKRNRRTVVIGGSATVENVIEKCGNCGKQIGKPKLDV